MITAFRSLATGAVVAGLCLATIFSPNSVWAAPSIANISVRGLTTGKPQVVVIDGADLLPDSRLVGSIPWAAQTPQPGGTPSRMAWEVTIPETVAPGIYPVRVANAKGISGAVLVAVDRLPHQALVERTEALPVALLGSLIGDTRVRTTITGTKGQVLAAEVESQRLGGSFRPVLRVIDSRGVQVAWSQPHMALGGDARLTTSLPADGTYTIEIHDVLFRAPGPGFFRLKLGAFGFADGAWPCGVTLGGQASLELRRTNLPAGSRLDFDARSLTVPGEYPATWAGVAAAVPLTGSPPRIWVGEYAEVPEPAEAEGARTVPAAPLAVHGCLTTAGQEDRFAIPVAPGGKFQVEVQAARFGSPLDGVLTVLGPQGNALASNDDRPGTADPAVDITVPADAQQIVAVVKDLENRGGPDFTYRLVVRDLNRPEFTLGLDTDRANIPAGGTILVTLPITRQGDPGAVQLEVPGLPAGVQAAGLTIPPTSGVGLVSLTAAAGTPPAFGTAQVVGRASQGQPPAVRAALTAESAGNRLQPWLRRDVAVAVVEPAPLTVVWQPGAADEKLTLGGKLPVKLQVTRQAGTTGAVRIRLVTSQIIPKKTVKQNNQDVQVDDVDKALRLEAAVDLAPEVSETAATLVVPADLPAGSWNLAFVAELLAADGKTVAVSAATPVRTLPASP